MLEECFGALQRLQIRLLLDVGVFFLSKATKRHISFLLWEGLDFVSARLCGRVSCCQLLFLSFPPQDERV